MTGRDASPRETGARAADAQNTGERVVDVVVIGGGPTGENVAQYAVEGGLTAALVEAELVGGECSYYACMPSKALLRPLEVLADAQHLGGITGARLEREALLARRDEWVSHYDDARQVRWATEAGIDVIRGRGRLVGERLVEVEGPHGPGGPDGPDGPDGPGGRTLLRARTAVVLATGSVPVVPGEYAALAPWGSRDATAVREVPERLVLVGGGVVAVEAATWLAALGSKVTLVARGGLLTSAEPFAGQLVEEGLRARGVDVRTHTTIRTATRDQVGEALLGRPHGGEVVVELGANEHRTGDDGADAAESTRRRITADEILVATGRRPNLDGLGLDVLGLTSDDVHEGRSPDWLYAIGDAGPGAPLTHMGKYEGRLLGAQLAEKANSTGHRTSSEEAREPATDSTDPADASVPQVVFTDPQVAWVGLTESTAREQGYDVVISRVPYTAAAEASLLRDGATGSAQLVVDRAIGHVLGATFIGPSVAELLHAATVAIVAKIPVRVLRHAVPAYPTASEVWLRLLEELPRRLR